MSYSAGMGTPRAAASARYASTIRSGTNSPGIGGPSWMRRRDWPTRAKVSRWWTAVSLTREPLMKRVTRYPSGRMNAVTSGPTPTPAAATVAACSTSRLMPSRWVSLPARRMT